MDGVAIPGLPQAPKADDFADQYPPEAGGLPAIGVSLASLMPSISSQGGDQSAAAPSAQPPTPGRGTSASTLSPRSKGYAQGVTKSGKRRRRHPVAEIKGGWTLEEDARLKQLVETYGEGSWSKLVPYFSGRIGKQLRERWNHELRPDIQKGAWKEEEEKALVEQHRVHRNAWADIARALPGRTCNAVKNHWNATLRRVNRGGQRTLQSPVEIYMDELGLIDTKNKNRPLHRTHNFHGNSRASGSNSAGGGRNPTLRWLPELPPAMKVLSAAMAAGADGQAQAAGPGVTESFHAGAPMMPGMALSTPAMLAPAAILPAASTALSANGLQPGIQLDVNQIAEKWGHSNGVGHHAPATQGAPEHMQNGTKEAGGAPGKAAAAVETSLKEPSAADKGKDADEGPESAPVAGGSKSKSPEPADQERGPSRSGDSAESSDESDMEVDIEKVKDGRKSDKRRTRRASTASRGQSTDPDAEEPSLRRSKRQRVSPQDAAFHFFARGEADKDKEAPSQQQHQQQRKPHLEEAAMALLLLDVHSAPAKGEEEGDGLPRSTRGRRLRPPSQRLDSGSSDDEGPPSPSVNLPRNARKRRTGWEEPLKQPNTPAGHPSSADATPKEHPPRLRQVADMATQTFTPAQLPLPLPLPGQPLGSVLQDTAHTALYGVNAAVASGGAANGKPGGHASTTNVRDKLAGFIVALAGMSDCWDRDASPALVRCRNGLGRSADPKVVALRQAVLEKCMAFKGPPPTQAVAAMAALLAEMAPIVAAAHESATAEDPGQGRYGGPGSIMGSTMRPTPPPSRPIQRATTHHFKSNPPLASVPPPAVSVVGPPPNPPGLNRAQMEAAMRALTQFPGLPLRPEMLMQAMAKQGSPRQVTSPHQTASPHMPLAGTPRTAPASASPLTALFLPALGSDKASTPSAPAASAANPTLAAAMAGMPLSQMLHMGPGMPGRHVGHLGPAGPSRLGSGPPAASPVPLPSSTAALSLPVPAGGSGLTVRTKLGPEAQAPLASPVVPVSTPSQSHSYAPRPATRPGSGPIAPPMQLAFLGAMTPTYAVLQQPGMTSAPMPGQAMAAAATAQPSEAAVQASGQAALPSNEPPAAF